MSNPLQQALVDAQAVSRHIGTNTNNLMSRMFKPVAEAVRLSVAVGQMPEPFSLAAETAISLRPYSKYKPGSNLKGSYFTSKVGSVLPNLKNLREFFRGVAQNSALAEPDRRFLSLVDGYLFAMVESDSLESAYEGMNKAFNAFNKKTDREPRQPGVMSRVGALSRIYAIRENIRELAAGGFYNPDAVEQTIGLFFGEDSGLALEDLETYEKSRSVGKNKKEASVAPAAEAAEVLEDEEEESVGDEGEVVDANFDEEDDEEDGGDEEEDGEDDEELQAPPVKTGRASRARR